MIFGEMSASCESGSDHEEDQAAQSVSSEQVEARAAQSEGMPIDLAGGPAGEVCDTIACEDASLLVI